MISGISEKYRKLLDILIRAQKGPFTIKTASEILKIPKDKCRILLAYLGRKGWLSRVKQGLYITVPLGTINPQEYKEHPWIVANKVFAPCYIGGWSAAGHWELTDQIFKSIIIITIQKFKNTRIKIQGTDYIIKKVNQKFFSKTKSVWIDNSKISVSDPIQTIVDILDDPSIGGGIRNVVDITKVYFNSQYRNDDEIIKYIEQKKNRTIYKRLGYIIESLNIDALKLKEKCQKNISSGFSRLDPLVENSGVYDSKWNLRINVSINR